MRYLDLELGRPRMILTLRGRLAVAGCTVIAIAACSQCWHQWRALSASREQLSYAESRVALASGIIPHPKQIDLPAPSVRRINRAIDDLNIPWPGLLGMIESIANRHISLLSVTPEPVTRILMLEADADNQQAMLTFVGDLEKRPEVAEVRFVKHQSTHAEPGHLVFDLAVSWKPDL